MSKPKTARQPKNSPPARTMVSPLSGAVCPTGAHPGNTGGKKGRSGRPPIKDQARDELLASINEHGVGFLRELMAGRVTITLNRVCEHCGKQSTGPGSMTEVLAALPTIDHRLSAFNSAAKYGLGTKDIHEHSGPDGAPIPVQIWRFGKREITF